MLIHIVERISSYSPVSHNVIMQVLFPAAFVVQQYVPLPVHWFFVRRSCIFNEHEVKLALALSTTKNNFPLSLHHHISKLTRIAERRFLTGLQRGYFFWGEGAAIHTQATTKPCRRPLNATESYVRLKHKLIQNIVPFWKTFVTQKKSTIFKWGLYNNF